MRQEENIFGARKSRWLPRLDDLRYDNPTSQVVWRGARMSRKPRPDANILFSGNDSGK